MLEVEVGRVVILKETQREGERYFWANPQCFVLWCCVLVCLCFFFVEFCRDARLFFCWHADLKCECVTAFLE